MIGFLKYNLSPMIFKGVHVGSLQTLTLPTSLISTPSFLSDRMTHFSDPTLVMHDLEVLKYLWHTANGLFLWEYLTTMDFELDVIQGRRPYRWTIWIYSLTRLSTLISVISSFVAMDSNTPINCQFWNTLELTFGYLGVVTASFLIVFRIIAIWNKNKLVVGTAIAVCATNVSVIILGIVQTRSVWDFVVQDCIVLNTEKGKPSLIVTLITYIVLLLVVLIGLLRLLNDIGGSFALGRLLWKQGVIWLLIATFAGVPPTVFIILNLNASLNLLPSAIAMSIAGTRIYRNLADYAYGSTDPSFVSLHIDGKIPKTKGEPSSPTTPSQSEETEDSHNEQRSTVQSIIGVHGLLGGDPHRSNFDSDLERGMPVESSVPR